MTPSARNRLIWDLIALSTVMYDAFMIPLSNAFSFELTLPLFLTSFLIAVFWSFDLVCMFFTGFVRDGVVEMRLEHIAMRYLKSWFLLDITVVAVDWCFILPWLILEAGSASGSNLLRALKTARALRGLRLLSLTRIGKTASLVDSMANMTHRELTDMLLKLGESVLVLLMSTHFIACLWFALGDLPGDDPTWVKVSEVSERPLLYQYATSFHWALTQFTPASMEVLPVNTWERLFTVVVDLCGLIGFSTFVSTLTTRMTQLRSFNKVRMGQHKALKNYLHENMISLETSDRILNFVQSNKNKLRPRTSADGIELLQDIPMSLRRQLDFEVFKPILSYHPLLRHLAFYDSECTYAICSAAISEYALAKQSLLFSKGDEGRHMYIVHSGQITYTRSRIQVSLQKSDWLSEAALWIKDWVHRGDCMAVKRADIIGISVEEFRCALEDSRNKSRPGARLGYRYAWRFINDTCSYDVASALRCSDIWGDWSHICGIIAQVTDDVDGVTKVGASKVARNVGRRSILPGFST